jgi:hypothetical protein
MGGGGGAWCPNKVVWQHAAWSSQHSANPSLPSAAVNTQTHRRQSTHIILVTSQHAARTFWNATAAGAALLGPNACLFVHMCGAGWGHLPAAEQAGLRWMRCAALARSKKSKSC